MTPTLRVLFAIMLVLPGCTMFPRNEAPPPPPSLASDPAEAEVVFPSPAEPAFQPVRSIETEMRVWRFMLPASADPPAMFWQQLSEDSGGLSSATVQHLQRNGLRIAIGQMAVWPLVQTILDGAGAEATTNELQIQNSALVNIALQSFDESRAIFFYREDGGLSGSRLSPGDLVLQIVPALDLNVLGRVTLRVTPTVQAGSGGRWQAGETTSAKPQVLEQLAFSVTLEPDQFLVIGPGGPGRVPQLAGSLLTTVVRAGQTFENIYCIAPRILRPEPAAADPIADEARNGEL